MMLNITPRGCAIIVITVSGEQRWPSTVNTGTELFTQRAFVRNVIPELNISKPDINNEAMMNRK